MNVQRDFKKRRVPQILKMSICTGLKNKGEWLCRNKKVSSILFYYRDSSRKNWKEGFCKSEINAKQLFMNKVQE